MTLKDYLDDPQNIPGHLRGMNKAQLLQRVILLENAVKDITFTSKFMNGAVVYRFEGDTRLDDSYPILAQVHTNAKDGE